MKIQLLLVNYYYWSGENLQENTNDLYNHLKKRDDGYVESTKTRSFIQNIKTIKRIQGEHKYDTYNEKIFNPFVCDITVRKTNSGRPNLR